MLTWQLMWRRAAAAFCEQQRPHGQGLRPAQHAPHVNHHMPRGRQLCGAVTGRQLPGLRWGLRCHSPLPGRPNRSGGPASDAAVSLNMGSPNLSVSVVSLAVGFATCQLWPRGFMACSSQSTIHAWPNPLKTIYHAVKHAARDMTTSGNFIAGHDWHSWRNNSLLQICW